MLNPTLLQPRQRPLSDADARLKHPNKPSANAWLSTSAPLGKDRSLHREDAIGRRDKQMIVLLVALAMVIRLYKLRQPSSVVFDEVHFGGFARKYIRQTFFMDVHPPLAKLLIALAAKIGGFKGDFDFKDIGKEYLGENVPYVTMRMLPALMGVSLIPLTYLTLRALGTSVTTATLGGILITFENGLIAQSRLILLDSPLIFFTALTIFLWVKFSNEDYYGTPFSKLWWRYLFLSGLSLGAVVSCKWVGLFTIATVGVCTLNQLWRLLGNLKVSPRAWLRHFFARSLCLIVVPVAFYMAMFQIHFLILNRSGDGDGFMSSEFQHTLIGHGMDDTYADVALGSHVTIRHVNTQGGYLHSHPHSYPGGSHQQQITLYPHRDDNNIWRVVNASADDGPVSFDWDNLPLQYVDNGMKIRLEHISTEKRLHSHEVRPPVSDVDFQNEVSGYGFPGFGGDANDDFFVEIVKQTRGGKDQKIARKRLRTLRSHFRLRHVMTGCYLFSHRTKLPEWGFEQQEVTCNKNPTWDNSLWYVETNTHAQLHPGDEMVNYNKPGFMAKFLELQAVMWRTNAGLTDRHAYDSRPPSWPLLRRGINFWVKHHRQIYLIGNPVIWWSSTVAVALYLASRGLLALRAKRGYRDLQYPIVQTYDEICGFLVIGWALHYLPFYLMDRQLFLHHYFPALWFAILCFCAVFDLVTRRVKRTRRIQAAGAIVIFALLAYGKFSPLTYGNKWTKAQCEKAKWLRTWDFSCADFYDSYSDYDALDKASQPSKAFAPPPQQTTAPPPAIDLAEESEEEITVTITSTIYQLPPEAGPNVFEDAAKPPEEKTSESVGPQREEDVPLASSPDGSLLRETTASVVPDTRAPVGRDAGAPEATDEAAIGGGAGWQGGAEDGPGLPKEAQQGNKHETEVAHKRVPMPEMQYDEETEEMVDQALKLDREEAIRQMEGLA